MEQARAFGPLILEVLSKYGFREVDHFENGGLAVTYANVDFAIQLVYEVHGKYASVMPLRDLEGYIPVEGVMECLLGVDKVESPPLDAVALFVDSHYSKLARIFGERDGGVEFRAIKETLQAKTAKLLHCIWT
jgi:hypothetical protein